MTFLIAEKKAFRDENDSQDVITVKPTDFPMKQETYHRLYRYKPLIRVSIFYTSIPA